MTARWTPLIALAAGFGGALLIALLVLGRDTEVFPTYLVYTADQQPLPRPGLVQLPDGSEVALRFERVPRDGTAEDVERLDRALSKPHVAGLVLDVVTYSGLAPKQLREWRHAGVVLVGHGLDAAQIMTELERDELPSARGGRNTFTLIAPLDTTRSVGNPSTIDRDRPFVGVAYLPPRSEDSEGDPIGWMAWFQADDSDLRELLVDWARESRSAYPAD
jgi:hypothetical protein